MIGTLHGGEIVLLILAALILLGPSRLPGYAAKLGQGVRYLRDLAEGAKGQIEEELGPTFQEIDWRQLDPRHHALIVAQPTSRSHMLPLRPVPTRCPRPWSWCPPGLGVESKRSAERFQ